MDLTSLKSRIESLSEWLFDDKKKADAISVILIFVAVISLALRFLYSIFYGI